MTVGVAFLAETVRTVIVFMGNSLATATERGGAVSSNVTVVQASITLFTFRGALLAVGTNTFLSELEGGLAVIGDVTVFSTVVTDNDFLILAIF